MKNLLFIIIILLTKPVYCDIIFDPMDFSPFAYSVETIGEYEWAFGKKNTMVNWGGIGLVGDPLSNNFPAFGLETGIEGRHYFRKDYKGINLDLYFGTALMFLKADYKGASNNVVSYIGVIPGIKLTYKFKIKNYIIIEPYISFSIPIYKSNQIFFNNNEWVPFMCLTAGIRIGINKLRIFKNK